MLFYLCAWHVEIIFLIILLIRTIFMPIENGLMHDNE